MGGKILKIAGGRYTEVADTILDHAWGDGGITHNSAGSINISAGKDITFGPYEASEITTDKENFPTGYWSYDYDGNKRIPGDSNHLYRTTLEKTVYFQLNVSDTVPTGTIISFKLFDYDTGLFMDWVNPDDHEFGGREITVKGIVREINGQKRITLELYLENTWKKEIAEDKGPFRDGCLDFYWQWSYKNVDWDSNKIQLSVYPSDYRLRIKPAYQNTNVLPEIYSHKGDIITFAIDQLPDGKIEKFVAIKIRKTTTFKFSQDVDNFKREIYTETINIKNNTLENASYSIEEVNHFFNIKSEAQQIYIDEKVIQTPVIKGTRIAYYNSAKQILNVGKKAANVFGHLMVLDEMRNMIPEMSHNGKFNLPALSTFISFIPGAQVIAFGIAVIEWMTMDIIREMDDLIEQAMWIRWQNIKTKGLQAVKSELGWAHDWVRNNRFQYIEVSQPILNKILKGDFKDIQEVIDISGKLVYEEKTHTIVVYRVDEPAIEDYFDVIDCIFINEND